MYIVELRIENGELWRRVWADDTETLIGKLPNGRVRIAITKPLYKSYIAEVDDAHRGLHSYDGIRYFDDLVDTIERCTGAMPWEHIETVRYLKPNRHQRKHWQTILAYAKMQGVDEVR